MGRILANLQNVDAPDSDFPYGRVRDNPGNNTGTPVNEASWGDVHQFFAKLAADAGITLNDLPESDYSGFQFNEALERFAIKANRFENKGFIIDGGGTTITTGLKGDLEISVRCKIIGVRLYGRGAGDTVIDIFKTDYAGFPSDVGDSITAAAKPTLSGGAEKYEDLVLPGWNVDVFPGDILAFNVDSNTTTERITITLLLDKFV